MRPWWVYIVQCNDQRLYVGATVDPEHRVRQHNGELAGGARFTRRRRPVVLVYLEYFPEGKIAALRREWRLKRVPVKQKRALVRAFTEQKDKEQP